MFTNCVDYSNAFIFTLTPRPEPELRVDTDSIIEIDFFTIKVCIQCLNTNKSLLPIEGSNLSF